MSDEMISCPYNSAHVILKSRMAKHLIKCRQQFPLENLTTCPFNATHDVPVPELKYHVDTCPDRKTMEKYLYVVDEDEKKEEALRPAEMNVPDLEENWDEETIPGSYNEVKSKVFEDQLFCKPPVGKSKTEKKSFLQSQIQKFQKTDPDRPSTSKFQTSELPKGINEKNVLKPLEPKPGCMKPKNEEEEEFQLGKRRKTSKGRKQNKMDTN